MRFRPCIDIHNGSVKQIVGATLNDADTSADENFVSQLDAAYYARLYRSHGLYGGHIIILNRADSEFYAADLAQARAALAEFDGGMQIGGGINSANAGKFIEMGASHVIVTSCVFKNGIIDEDELSRLVRAVGKERLTLDLSCKKRGGRYYIVTDRWQKFTDTELTAQTLERLAGSCAEFLVHAADAEGKQRGIECGAAEILRHSPIPCTYAGGIASQEDISLLGKLGGEGGMIDFTIGSALDIFGGSIPFAEAAKYNK